jgi:hypothetical protein
MNQSKAEALYNIFLWWGGCMFSHRSLMLEDQFESAHLKPKRFGGKALDLYSGGT